MNMTYLRLTIVFGIFFLSNACTENSTDFNIANFGAKPIPGRNNQANIQDAINKCASQGGGRVIIPVGEFFTGAIKLKSNVELYLESGAILKASAHKADYLVGDRQYTRLIVAENASEISITGKGTILGTGEKDGGVKRGVDLKMPEFRPGLIEFNAVRNIKIEDVLLKHSDFFALSLNKCEDVLINNITIRNNYFHPNSDGIDPAECRNVIISNCNIISGDDCICLKNGGENIIISNCILSTPSSAIKFGTSTEKTFTKINVNNCIIYNSMVGIGIFMKDGGMVNDVSFSNITIEDIQDTSLVNTGIIHQQVPVYIDIDKRTEDSPLGVVKNIRFSNISINSYNSILIQGMIKQPVEDLFMDKIYFNVSRPFDFSTRKKPKGFADSKFLYHDDHRLTEFAVSESYITLANIREINLSNIYIKIPEEIYYESPRNAIALYNVENITTNNIKRNIDPAGLVKSIISSINQ